MKNFSIKRYRLTSSILSELHGDRRFTSDVLAELRPVINLAFTKKEFLRAIKNLIGDQNPEIIQIIMGGADRFTLNRIKNSLVERWFSLVAPSRYVLPLGSYLCLRPLLFTIIFRTRLFFFYQLKNFFIQNTVRELLNSNVKGYHHNKSQISSFLSGHRERTETFAILLKCIKDVNLNSSRTLCVGPRNEAEVLLLKRYGFANLIAIDLFSYSPLIRVMDMNNLTFPDDYFDIYYSSFVLGYSPDITKTLHEAIRVTKSGGLHVFGFTTTVGEDTYGLTPKGSNLKDLTEFEAIMFQNIDHVYWRDCWKYMDQLVFTIIFRIKK